MLITLLCSPILTRIFSPHEFGLFATYAVIIAIIGNVSSARYDVTILLPRKEKDADSLFLLSHGILSALCGAVAIILMTFGEIIFDAFGLESLNAYRPIMAVMVLSLGSQLIFNNYLNRHKEYATLSKGKIMDAAMLNAISIGLGYLGFGVWGLVLGQLIGRITSILYVVFKVRDRLSSITKGQTWDGLKEQAVKYSSFPKHSVAATLAGSFSANIHILLFLALYGDYIVGIIALATRLIVSPLQIFSGSFSQVFYQKLSRIDDAKILQKNYLKGAAILSIAAVAIILFVMLLPQNTIGFIFSDTWADAMIYIKIMIFWFAAQFIGSTLSCIFMRLEQERWVLVIQIFNLLFSFLSITLSSAMGWDIITALIIFTISKVFLYSVVLIFPLFLIRNHVY